ncbi:hypothetical protein MSAN_01020300 [Mycena sanguinolenta]|uniref:Mid2 domain-containing protein n=1 Tax=Mycena sanguinolenta TaxID=230812 RepID=A0A8H6YR42_9AGAR|nr:hypothetical protein MSAN_01020300 [Mycena sanguinolenta]
MLPAIFSTFVLARIALGQPNTNATCNPSFAWASNSLRQSPCLVAAYLGSVCDDGLFFVPALDNSLSFYQGPTVAQANSCGCSSAFYSLLGACAQCQSAQVLSWSAFSENCTTTYSQIYPDNIPTGTAVPHWAYQNVTGGTFNSTLAQLNLNAPESTANSQPTSATLPPGSSNTSSPKKSKAGPIAGGVVGGVVFICLVCIAAFWFIRRRHRGVALVPTPIGYYSDITFSSLQTPKLYNPSDPSTFPSPSASM